MINCACEQCGAPFVTKVSKIAKGYGRFCSRTCWGLAKRKGEPRICPVCGTAFYAPRAEMNRRGARFCSRQCAANPLGSDAARFRSKVQRSADPDACWPWLGARDKDGYGKFWFKGRNVPAHTFAWMLANTVESLPIGLVGRHVVCDNPPCCREDHVQPGTTRENVRDMMRKGRHARLSGDDHPLRKRPELAARGDRNGSRTHPERLPRGERHHWHGVAKRGESSYTAKLNAALVQEIRARHADGGISQQALATEYGVSQTQVGRIVRGERWSHLPHVKPPPL